MKKSTLALSGLLTLLIGFQTSAAEPQNMRNCEIMPEVGENADLGLMQNQNVQISHFRKPYNRNWLEAVSRTSGPETIRIVESSGAQLFKIASADPFCHYYQSLNSAPTDLSKKWTEVVGDSTLKKSELLGLYMPISADYASTARQPAILINESTDRYTLVHEFMHHNFNSYDGARVSYTQEMIMDDMQKSIKNLEARTKAYNEKKNVEDVQAMAQNLLQLAQLYDQLMVRFMLEEVTIEVILGADYEKGILKNVSKKSYINGGFYILNNVEQFKKFTQSVREEAERLRQSVASKHAAILKDAVKKIDALKETREQELKKIIQSAVLRVALAPTLSLADLSSPDSVSLPVTCPQSLEVIQFLQETSDRLKEHQQIL